MQAFECCFRLFLVVIFGIVSSCFSELFQVVAVVQIVLGCFLSFETFRVDFGCSNILVRFILSNVVQVVV